MEEKLYMAVTPDKYELPIKVGTLYQIAAWANMSQQKIRQKCSDNAGNHVDRTLGVRFKRVKSELELAQTVLNKLFFYQNDASLPPLVAEVTKSGDIINSRCFTDFEMHKIFSMFADFWQQKGVNCVIFKNKKINFKIEDEKNG